MTRKQNKRNLWIAFALLCGSMMVFVVAAIDNTLLTELPSPVRHCILLTTFFAMTGFIVFFGPLGVFPHFKKMLPENSLYWDSLWFVPDLEE